MGRTNGEAEAPILWPPDVKNGLIGKDPDAEKDWRQEKGATEEMVRWHHQLIGHDFEPTLGDSEGQGSQESCNPWGHKASDMTEWGNNSNWYHKGFPVGSAVKTLPTETWVQFLGWEDALGKELAIYSSFLPGKSDGQRSLASYSPWCHKESDMT